jgi:uncharacterized membrane protein YGL010W
MHPVRTALDLLAHYAASHRDQRNITTHFVSVPLIVLGVGILLARARFDLGGREFSAAWLAFLPCALWYLSRRGAFTLNLAVTAAMAVLAAMAHTMAEGSLGNWLAWGVGSFVFGWMVQFLGHYYEGKAPIVVEGLTALLVGPMFVTAEALFALGWNKPLLAEIERRAGPTYLRDLAHPA